MPRTQPARRSLQIRFADSDCRGKFTIVEDIGKFSRFRNKFAPIAFPLKLFPGTASMKRAVVSRRIFSRRSLGRQSRGAKSDKVRIF